MYAKRIDRYRIHCPSRPYLKENGRIYTNPTHEQLRRAGYKLLVEKSPCPKEIEHAHIIFYEEDENHVYICYRGRGE